VDKPSSTALFMVLRISASANWLRAHWD